MENLTDLQKKAIESLRSKRTLNTRNPQALEFSDDQIAEEMQLLQAGEQELQKRKEANAKVEEERQQRISDENDKEQTARLDKQYRNKALGLGQKYDPKMLEYASTIFPSLKEMGLSSGPISPEVKTARSPAVESPVSEEEMLDETENVAEEETTSPYNSIKKSVMKTEGGFSNNPDDKGGATNKGITLQTYSQFLGRPASVEELKNISDKDVDSIFSRYYNEAGGDRIKDPRIQEVLTDQNYNKGTNFLNRINDMLGTPRGSSLSQEAIDRINNMDPDQFIAAVLQSEREIYKKIAEKDPSQKQFSRGWDLRIQNLANKMGVNLETKMSEEKSESPNIAELIKKARQEQDEASTASQFAKLRDAIIGVGAGRVIKTDTSAYDERQLKALRPIEDLTLKQQLESNQAKNDPNSSISKLIRRSLAEMDIDMTGMDKISYAQLEKLYPSLVTSLYNKISLDTKKEIAKEKNLNAQLLKQQEIDKKKKEAAKISDKQLTPISDVDSVIANLDNVISIAKEKFVGPVDARIPDIMTSGEEAAFRSAVGRMVDAYRKAITGAGASAMELQKLESRLPDPKDTIAQFKGKAFEFRKELVRNRTTYVNTLKKQGKDVSEFEQAADQQQTLSPEERLKKYEEMIKRVNDLKSRQG
jgi:lysozyme family protein